MDSGSLTYANNKQRTSNSLNIVYSMDHIDTHFFLKKKEQTIAESMEKKLRFKFKIG